jgi:hypothetical protein
MLLFLPGLTSGDGNKTNPFGIPVRNSVLSLVREIESKYGHPLIERSLPEGGAFGESGVTDEGYPFVSLSIRGQTESTLVHELMHLRLHARGFAAISWRLPLGTDTQSNRTYVNWLSAMVRDSIEHLLVYPEIRKHGIDPDPEDRRALQEFVKTGAFRGLQAATRDDTIAIYYFRAQLLQKSILAGAVHDRYVRNGWQKQARIGEVMAKKVLRATPVTPESEVSSFVECINNLLAGRARFAVESWGQRQRGTFSERFVVITVSPLGDMLKNGDHAR